MKPCMRAEPSLGEHGSLREAILDEITLLLEGRTGSVDQSEKALPRQVDGPGKTRVRQHDRSGDQQEASLEPIDYPSLNQRILDHERTANDMDILGLEAVERPAIFWRQVLHRRRLLRRQFIEQQIALDDDAHQIQPLPRSKPPQQFLCRNGTSLTLCDRTAAAQMQGEGRARAGSA